MYKAFRGQDDVYVTAKNYKTQEDPTNRSIKEGRWYGQTSDVVCLIVCLIVRLTFRLIVRLTVRLSIGLVTCLIASAITFIFPSPDPISALQISVAISTPYK